MKRMTCGFMIATIGALFSVGCSKSVYVPSYSFVPQPAVVDVVRRDKPGGSALTVLATVYGVRYADDSRHLPPSVEVRLRFENNGSTTVHFDPNSLDLMTGSLRGFQTPILAPAQVIDLAPGERAGMTAYFPFPPDRGEFLDLQNLRLRWAVKVAGETVPQTAVFHRFGGGDGRYYEETDPSVAY